jgi:hypothetical protein
VAGASIVSHGEADLAKVKSILDTRGFREGGIASPFLKCHIQEIEDQWEVLERSFEITHLFEAPLVRAFSFLRVQDSISVREEVALPLDRGSCSSMLEELLEVGTGEVS